MRFVYFKINCTNVFNFLDALFYLKERDKKDG